MSMIFAIINHYSLTTTFKKNRDSNHILNQNHPRIEFSREILDTIYYRFWSDQISHAC